MPAQERRRRDRLRKFFHSSHNTGSKNATIGTQPGRITDSNVPDCTSPAQPASEVDNADPAPSVDRHSSSTSHAPPEGKTSVSPPASLWVLASENLDTRSKALLDLTQGDLQTQSAPRAVEAVRCQIEAAYNAYLKQGLTIKFGKNTINVRDQAKKILTSTMAFKSCIDVAAGSDPTGHAAAAWSVISFALKLAQNDMDRFNDIMESSAFLANILARYKSVETNYLTRSFEESDQLKAAIVEAYTAILEYTAAVKKASEEDKLRRVLATFEALSGQPLQALKTSIGAKDEKVEMWRRMIANQYRLAEFTESDQKADAILKKLDQTASDMAAVKRAFLTREKEELLKWLSSIDISSSYNRCLSFREPGTGTWFIASDEYRIWKETTSSFAWLYGTCKSAHSLLQRAYVHHMRQLVVVRLSCGKPIFDISCCAVLISSHVLISEYVRNMVCCYLRLESKDNRYSVS